MMTGRSGTGSSSPLRAVHRCGPIAECARDHLRGAPPRHRPVRRHGRLHRPDRVERPGGRPRDPARLLRDGRRGDRTLRRDRREVHRRRGHGALWRAARPRRRPGACPASGARHSRGARAGRRRAGDQGRSRHRRGGRRRGSRVAWRRVHRHRRRGERRRTSPAGGRAGRDRGRRQHSTLRGRGLRLRAHASARAQGQGGAGRGLAPHARAAQRPRVRGS